MNHFNIFPDVDQRMRDAIQFFRATRDGQIIRKAAGEVHDQGNRSAVTGGKQLDGFIELIRDILVANEVSDGDVFCNTKLELPGFYRPSKKWDLLVVDDGQLIIAVELKSQVGPSF